MYHEMDIKRIILMNQHLDFEINLYYHSVGQVDYKFLMPIETEELNKFENRFFFFFSYHMFSSICW